MNDSYPAIERAILAVDLARLAELNAHRYGSITDQIKAHREYQIALVQHNLARLELIVLPRRIASAQSPDATALEADDLFDTEQRIASLKASLSSIHKNQ